MDGPVITLAAGETLWLDGRMIRFHTPSRIELPHATRFIRGRDVLEAEPDGTLELDAYLAVQACHLATRPEYHRSLEAAQAALARLQGAEATLAGRALAMHRSHHALLALRPLVAHYLADEQRTALCA